MLSLLFSYSNKSFCAVNTVFRKVLHIVAKSHTMFGCFLFVCFYRAVDNSTNKVEYKNRQIDLNKIFAILLQQLPNVCFFRDLPKAQYTPSTAVQLNCRVESRRRWRCEQNSQLAHDDC